MAKQSIPLFALLVVAGVAAHASAQAATTEPTALVEDVNSKTAKVEFMDYVGPGQVISLAPGDQLVLSYLKSCEHETIKGGKVVVGAERSEVEGGTVVRNRVPCQGGRMELTTQQASKSGASAFRLQSTDPPTLYGRTPVIEIPRDLAADARTLVIMRVDRLGERHKIEIDPTVRGGAFVDLAKAGTQLSPGGTYSARLGDHRAKFQIDKDAKSGATPVISRILRFQD